MPASEARLEIARIGKPHGLRGEVHLWPVSNRPERFSVGARSFAGERELVITAIRSEAAHYVAHFSGVDDRNAAAALTGTTLLAAPLGDLPEGEFWVHELIGLHVIDQHDTVLGVVDALQENPAHDLLVLETGTLIPMVFVQSVTETEVRVELPQGFLELDEA